LPVFLIFSKKIKKTGNQTLFYFAAGGGEMLVIHHQSIICLCEPTGGFSPDRYRLISAWQNKYIPISPPAN